MSTEDDFTGVRKHLKEIIEGAAFRGSQRSTQFLRYVVEQAISGHLESLKERAIGIELFGRPATYDTGEDAIVRVTASDVRRRLSHHYTISGNTSAVRISLPPGSYLPEIACDSVHPAIAAAPRPAPGSTDSDESSASREIMRIPGLDRRSILVWLLIAICLVGSNAASWMLSGRLHSSAGPPQNSVVPWSALFYKEHPTILVTSDPNIAEIQGLTRSIVTVSDYANRQYIPAEGILPPDLDRFAQHILRGDKAANVDTPIVAGIAELAQANSGTLRIRPARDFRFSDLDTDSNFVFLGSPRTDPWVTLFDDQLDFRFYFDKGSWQEVIRNAHPRPGEAAEYVPTAKGLATGESFATISFVRNSDHAGQVLLLAGANAEGTKATGELVTDIPRLSAALQHCGIRSFGPEQHFQLLLHLNIMAGSPRTFDVLSCHILP